MEDIFRLTCPAVIFCVYCSLVICQINDVLATLSLVSIFMPGKFTHLIRAQFYSVNNNQKTFFFATKYFVGNMNKHIMFAYCYIQWLSFPSLSLSLVLFWVSYNSLISSILHLEWCE